MAIILGLPAWFAVGSKFGETGLGSGSCPERVGPTRSTALCIVGFSGLVLRLLTDFFTNIQLP